MQPEQRDRQPVRRRPLPTRHALFNAVPRDLHARAQPLRTERRTVPNDQRRARLAILWERYRRLNSLRAAPEDIFQERGYGGRGQAEGTEATEGRAQPPSAPHPCSAAA